MVKAEKAVDMQNNAERLVYFLSWESPWPGNSGGALRAQGLLAEIAKGFKTHLVILTEKKSGLLDMANDVSLYRIEIVPMRSRGLYNKSLIAAGMLRNIIPYHCEIALRSLKKEGIDFTSENSQAIFYSAGGNFASLIPESEGLSKKWIIDQFDVPTQYWLLRKKEYFNPAKKMMARVNYGLARRFYADIYERIGCVISVCEEDRDISRLLAPEARIEIIENGVDTALFKPSREKIKRTVTTSKRILFTGTSNERNIRAICYFLEKIMPAIKKAHPGAELIVAGDFSNRSMRYIKKRGEVRFTGKVEDIRPIYDSCDVFINPFKEAYGSKLKISQALAMGICIITTKEGGRGFKLVDAENAFVAGNDEEFICKTIEALSDANIRNRIAEKGRQYAEEYLDWRILGEKVRSIVCSIN